MSREPVLYVGIAAPLIEMARVWLVELPKFDNAKERTSKLKAFPKAQIGAYNFSLDAVSLSFRTGFYVNKDRIQAEVEAWAGKPPDLLPNLHVDPIPPLDHRKALSELRNALLDQPVRIVSRIGLTLQQLQRDLSELRPELVLLNCHGTQEGYLLLEDGRARADFIPGEHLFPLLRPRPRILFLAACHSEAVLQRAGEETDWKNGAIVHVLGETPIEVGACVAFQSMFHPALLRGETAGEAFDAAKQYLANDPGFGDLTVAIQEIAPSTKFQINEDGRAVCLSIPSAAPAEDPTKEIAPPSPRRSNLTRRTSDRFVGRRREMAQILDALLPVRAGIQRADRRIVTLTKEGGIGKTAMATEVSDWACERDLFPGGVFELACERFTSAQEFLSHLLTLFGVPPADQRGDLLALLTAVLPHAIHPDQPALLLLDNLDDLFRQDAPREVREQTTAVLETALTAASNLRVLATCRWPLGLSDYETEQEVPPMAEDEARDVFASHLEYPAHRLEAQETWRQPDSPIRQIVLMSGRHPQSLQLLARQMGRKGMTLEKLRDEAREDLLKVLTDPLAQDDETNRLKKVAVSYELSYRHLSADGKRLFERLSRLPGGVWCGEFAEHFMDWHDLFGENWRDILEKELDYFALVHYEPDDPDGETGVFEMLRPMLEFARKKYEATDHKEWEKA